jgi:hypothetical protein
MQRLLLPLRLCTVSAIAVWGAVEGCRKSRAASPARRRDRVKQQGRCCSWQVAGKALPAIELAHADLV